MNIVFFLASILFSCLPLLHSATENNISMPICPESFSCPNLAPFNYPFFNAANSGCGLIKVNCSSNNRTFQLGGQAYEIVGKSDSRPSVLIYNRTFDALVKDELCEALMNNFSSPRPLVFSTSITPFVTLYKCNKNPNYAAEINTYFHKLNYNNYNICKNHNFFYKYSVSNATVLNDLPHRCEVIQLPVKTRWQFGPGGPNETNISSLLSPYYSILFQLTPSCDRCHQKGGRCHTTHGNFLCLDVDKEKPSRKLIQILVLSIGAALVVGAATISIIKILSLKGKFGWRLKAKYNINAELFLQNHEFLAPSRYSYSQVQKMTNSFEVKLGQGGFGSVYKGALHNNNVIAVKVLSESKENGEDFINEVASVGRTCHVNIVSLVGFCLEGRRRALIYEFMPNGSLEKFIYGRSSPSNSHLGWEKLHQIAVGIARGLEYLHKGCNTRILHFDIKPHNILLDKDFCPKISDFGLAKLFPENRSMMSISNMRGTPGYIAPELFSRGFGEVSHKSDVYSYGMMILEMVGGRKNIEVGVDHTSEIYFPHWIYKKVELDEDHLGLHGIMNDEENGIAKKMIIVGLWCIQTNPLNRPTITKALEMLEGNLKLLEIPPKPYMSSPTRCVVGSPSTDLLHPCCSSTNTL